MVRSTRKQTHLMLHMHRDRGLGLEWAALGGYLIGLTGAPCVPCPKIRCSVGMHMCAEVCIYTPVCV